MGEGLFFCCVVLSGPCAQLLCARGGKGGGGVAMAKGDLQGMNSFLSLLRNEWVAKTSLHMKIVGVTVGGRNREQYPPQLYVLHRPLNTAQSYYAKKM